MGRMLRCMEVRRRRGSGALRSPRQELVDAVFERVHLQPPWTVDEFRRWLSEHLGVSIELRRSDPDSDHLLTGECGLVAVKGSRAVIWYDASRSPRHQRQQVFHEFAHLLCGHHEARPLEETLKSGEHPLVAGMSPAMIEAVFGPADPPRQGRDRSEAEAELIGTKLAVLSVSDSSARSKRNYARVLSLWSGGRA